MSLGKGPETLKFIHFMFVFRIKNKNYNAFWYHNLYAWSEVVYVFVIPICFSHYVNIFF
jgi:hypothetical protein